MVSSFDQAINLSVAHLCNVQIRTSDRKFVRFIWYVWIGRISDRKFVRFIWYVWIGRISDRKFVRFIWYVWTGRISDRKFVRFIWYVWIGRSSDPKFFRCIWNVWIGRLFLNDLMCDCGDNGSVNGFVIQISMHPSTLYFFNERK